MGEVNRARWATSTNVTEKSFSPFPSAPADADKETRLIGITQSSGAMRAIPPPTSNTAAMELRAMSCIASLSLLHISHEQAHRQTRGFVLHGYLSFSELVYRLSPH